MDGRGLYSVNRGDAICIINSVDPAKVVMPELILNPVLCELSMDIDAEIAALIAKHFGSAEAIYKTPGAGMCQSMVCGLHATTGEGTGSFARKTAFDAACEGPAAAEDPAAAYEEPYYGFPLE